MRPQLALMEVPDDLNDDLVTPLRAKKFCHWWIFSLILAAANCHHAGLGMIERA